MTDKLPTSQKKNALPLTAEPPTAIFALDEFIIPSLVEARLKGLPLSQEESQFLTLIQQDERLSQEYYGLLSVLGHLGEAASATVSSPLNYLYSDEQSNIYRAKEDQTQRRLKLVESGARLSGLEFSTTQITNNYQVGSPELGFALDFSQSSTVQFIRTSPQTALGAVAETAQAYQVHASDPTLNPTGWRLYAQTDDRQFEFAFDPAGKVQLPADLPPIHTWKLLKTTTDNL